MNKIKKAVLAVSVVVLASGCVHTQALDETQAAAKSATAPVAEAQTLRPMQSYGTFGGYRYRRFTGA